MKEVEKIWLTDTAVYISLIDGQTAFERFADYPRLKDATPEQRENFVVDQFGISWPDLDEDLSFDGFFTEKNRSVLYDLFMDHPELNASAVARRVGISQSLFAQYISGIKRPSPARLKEILRHIRTIGQELASLPDIPL